MVMAVLPATLPVSCHARSDPALTPVNAVARKLVLTRRDPAAAATLGRAPQAVTPEEVDQCRDNKQNYADQDCRQSERDQHHREVAVGIEDPMMDRGQHE